MNPYNPEPGVKRFETNRAFAAECDSWTKGMCAVTPFEWLISSSPYEVIATDHTSYSVVYTCDNYFGPFFKVEAFWILTR